MTQAITLHAVTPQAGVSGGHVALSCAGLESQALATCRIVFGASATRPMLTTPTLLFGVVAEGTAIRNVHVVQGERQSNTVPFAVATRLADNLHPVASPAVDAQGNIYTTISGTKDQHVPVSLYRISPEGEVVPLPATIANPTSLAFGPDGTLYISSRHEGTVYRVHQQGTAVSFATQLGIATGLAFDAQGRLYVGDRRGAILQVAEDGTFRVFARLVPTMTGYHLAFADDGWLYVSFPTLSGSDQIYRITPDGEVQPFVGGLGRAQGIAFDAAQNLYVAAHYEGEGGVVCITPAGVMTRVVAGVNLVGLAFGTHGDLILTDNSTVYKLAFGVQGRLSPA
jgi:sugar lactone lactonase YvrE